MTDFDTVDVGIAGFADDLDLAIDPNGDLHVAFIGYVGSISPGAMRVVYYGYYDESANTWDFDPVADYTHPGGHINPDDPQVAWKAHETLGFNYTEIEWTVRDASVVPGGRHTLYHAEPTVPGTLGAWTSAVIHEVEGPVAAITNSVFVIGDDGVAHSSFIARPPIDPSEPGVVPCYSLWYGTNTTLETLTFTFTKIREGDATMEPAKANSIALGDTGDVHIAYHENVNNTLNHITDEAVPGTFVDELVDSAAATDLGRRCVIDVNGDGGMFIAYQDFTNGKLKAALWMGGGPWGISDVVNAGVQNARYVGAALNVWGEAMAVHDAKVADADKKVSFASLANTAPVADAAGPYLVECRNEADGSTSVLLDGSASMDPDSDLITFLWTTTVPGGSFDDAALEQPTLTVSGATLGTAYDVTLTVDDGTTSTDVTVSLTVQDTVDPVLTCPADIVEVAMDPTGNTVNFAPTATDACDASVTVTTSIPSGSLFAPGTTTVVTVTATDDSSNSVQCTFSVQIMTVEEVLDSIIDIIMDLEGDDSINSGEANSLTTRLSNVEGAVAKDNTNAACAQIAAFINTVQGKIDRGQIDPTVGQAMIDAATSIQTSIGCGP